MSKTKKLEQIAKTLFQYYHCLKPGEELDKKWADLPHDGGIAYMYTMCKKEYFRMAKGVFNLQQEEKAVHERESWGDLD